MKRITAADYGDLAQTCNFRVLRSRRDVALTYHVANRNELINRPVTVCNAACRADTHSHVRVTRAVGRSVGRLIAI